MSASNIHKLIEMHSSSDINNFIKTCSSSTINSIDDIGRTPLHIACAENLLNVVCRLIKKKADINMIDSYGWTPLHCAANAQAYDICDKLLQTKANLHAKTNEDNSILHYLVKGKPASPEQIKLIEKILPKDVNAANIYGETPFARACQSSPIIVELLLKHKADVNIATTSNISPLHFAVRNRCVETVKLLLEANADPHIKSKDGFTAIEESKDIGEGIIARYIETKAQETPKKLPELQDVLKMPNVISELKTKLSPRSPNNNITHNYEIKSDKPVINKNINHLKFGSRNIANSNPNTPILQLQVSSRINDKRRRSKSLSPSRKSKNMSKNLLRKSKDLSSKKEQNITETYKDSLLNIPINLSTNISPPPKPKPKPKPKSSLSPNPNVSPNVSPSLSPKVNPKLCPNPNRNQSPMLTRTSGVKNLSRRNRNITSPVNSSLTKTESIIHLDIPNEIKMGIVPQNIQQKAAWQNFEEILFTETQYVRQIATLIRLFKQPLQRDNIGISREDIKNIFSNIEDLYFLSSRLLKSLNEEKPKPPCDRMVGKVFLEYTNEFKNYKTYCTNQIVSYNTLESLKSNKKFSDFINNAQTNDDCNHETINGFLIKPFQRVCRYVLLLKELRKNTPKTWNDYENIEKAIQVIDNVVREANETKRAMDNELKIQEIHSILDIELDRKRAVKFICEGVFKEYEKGQLHKRHIYLFNKLLVITKPSKGKHITKYCIPLEYCIVWDKQDLEGKDAFQIVRTDSTQRVVITCHSDIIKENWMYQINEAISHTDFMW